MKKKIKRQHGPYERQSLWARGYFALTIGMDENIIKRYAKHQKHHNEVDQPSLFEKLTNQIYTEPLCRRSSRQTQSHQLSNWWSITYT